MLGDAALSNSAERVFGGMACRLPPIHTDEVLTMRSFLFRWPRWQIQSLNSAGE